MPASKRPYAGIQEAAATYHPAESPTLLCRRINKGNALCVLGSSWAS